MNERRFCQRLLALLLSALLICPLLPISALLADARAKGEPHTAATTSTEKNELPNYQHYFGESTLNEHLYLVDEVLFTDNWYSHVERAYRDRNGVVTMIDPHPSQEVIDRCGNKPEVSVSGSQITITGGGQLRHADGDKVGRYFLILYAQDVDAINGCSKYVNVTIDTIGTTWENVGFEVYLGEALLTMAAIVLVTWLCVRSKEAAARVMVSRTGVAPLRRSRTAAHWAETSIAASFLLSSGN